MARAAADGYKVDGTDVEPEPYLGYYYRVLTKQGPHAPGGALDYMANGEMVAGHALLAFPSDYGDTGVMSFMVGEAAWSTRPTSARRPSTSPAPSTASTPATAGRRSRRPRPSSRGSAPSRAQSASSDTGFAT